MSYRLRGGLAGAVGVLALIAAGCQPMEQRPTAPVAPPATTSAPPGAEPFTPPAVKPAPPKPAPKPAPAPATPPNLTLPELVGLSEQEVAQLLGTADSLREEPPATVWGYRAGTCALDLFFYMDMESKRFRALAYDVSTTDGTRGDPALNVCLKQIMDRRR